MKNKHDIRNYLICLVLDLRCKTVNKQLGMYSVYSLKWSQFHCWKWFVFVFTLWCNVLSCDTKKGSCDV